MSKEPYMFVKEQGGLRASDVHTYERLDAFPEGTELKALTLTMPRSYPFQGYYWATLGTICKATEIAPTSRHLHKALLKLCKYVQPVYDMNGKVIELVEDSTAFDAMEQPEFEAYVEHAKRALAEHIGINWDDYTLNQLKRKG